MVRMLEMGKEKEGRGRPATWIFSHTTFHTFYGMAGWPGPHGYLPGCCPLRGVRGGRWRGTSVRSWWSVVVSGGQWWSAVVSGGQWWSVVVNGGQ